MYSFRLAIRGALLPLCISLFALFGCSSSSSPTDPGNTGGTTDNQQAEAVSKTGVQIYQNINSFKNIDTFKSGKIEVDSLGVTDFANRGAATQFGRKVARQALQALRRQPAVQTRLASAFGDSVIFDFTERDTVEGVTQHVVLFYDPQTGIGRLTVVGFDFSDEHVVDYDSTELVVDLGGTVFDDSDDVLKSVASLKRYRAGQLIQQEEGTFVADPHAPGTEPDGGILTSVVTYTADSFIQKTTERFEYHPNTGGSYSKTSEFSDNTTHTESATFNDQGTGTFSEKRRDGTRVDGTFDGAEQDGSGSYSITTTFPAGHDPVSVAESATFSYDTANDLVNGSFERTATKLDGTTEHEESTVAQTRNGDVLTTTITSTEVDGSHGKIVLTESPDVEQAAGEWTNADQTFITFQAQNYSDGSSHLEAKQYANKAAFDDGSAPAATAVFDFYPDGSGVGVVTEGADVYDVVISPDGSVTVTKRG